LVLNWKWTAAVVLFSRGFAICVGWLCFFVTPSTN
jgi:hypothetical protein